MYLGGVGHCGAWCEFALVICGYRIRRTVKDVENLAGKAVAGAEGPNSDGCGGIEMKFVHIADVHLGVIPDAAKPWCEERSKELMDTFSAVMDVCNQERADLLLIAGDLFHRQPLLRELREVNAQFARLQQTQVVLIAGNHDPVNETSYYKNFVWNDNVHFLQGTRPEKVYFPFLDAEVWGWSCRSDAVDNHIFDEIVLEQSETYKILLGHVGDGQKLPANWGRIINKGFDYMALGHVHAPYVNLRDKYAYAGSLEPISARELRERGYILGEITPEGTMFSLVPFAKREYKRISYTFRGTTSLARATEEITKLMEQEGAQNYFSITLLGKVAHRPEHWLEKLEANLKNVVQILDKTRPDVDVLEVSHEHAEDLIGKYMEALHQMTPETLASEFPGLNDAERRELPQRALLTGLDALLDE